MIIFHLHIHQKYMTDVLFSQKPFYTGYCPACGTSDLGLTASAPLLLRCEFSFYLGFKSS